ncbi:MAG: substrate-binding domain-containing protein [Polaromonas sp.]|uniref:molybdate ABC transporter substrate-binding protein n=1 Tax=Polaromonas sp. TaxID=1869339 RepID=UPI0025F79D41|nr:substrate-binding domain-containing protein [Polaromonas sp.]MBI2728211.1 substrate-binding domain-containing protein [Polaromonas sp.]
MDAIRIFSGGAAQGLITRLKDGFTQKSGISVDGTFGAVGMMKDKLLAGEPCDIMILSDALINELTGSGDLVAGTAQALGAVKTGVAVKTGEKAVDVSNQDALKAALRAARGIYFPDPIKATAGIHVMKVLKALGLDVELADRLRPYPNGATAMKAMAECAEAGLIGSTQATEILLTKGVELVAMLPKEFELATVYTAAVCTKAGQPQVARDLIAMLASAEFSALRRDCGFEA